MGFLFLFQIFWVNIFGGMVVDIRYKNRSKMVIFHSKMVLFFKRGRG